MENTTIMFLPVCLKCRKIILETIEVDEYAIEANDYRPSYAVSPVRCPHCGAFFKRVSMPTKLPFNALDFLT